jgi:hypothetical protein
LAKFVYSWWLAKMIMPVVFVARVGWLSLFTVGWLRCWRA